jgi:hypothetical protein
MSSQHVPPYKVEAPGARSRKVLVEDVVGAIEIQGALHNNCTVGIAWFFHIIYVKAVLTYHVSFHLYFFSGSQPAAQK